MFITISALIYLYWFKECPVCEKETCPTNVMNCPKVQYDKKLGLNIKDSKEMTNTNLLLRTQNVINFLQNKACEDVSLLIASHLEDSMKTIKNKNCNALKLSIERIVSMSNIDYELKTMITQIYESLIKDLCVNGKVDIKLLTSVIKDLYDTMCYKKW